MASMAGMTGRFRRLAGSETGSALLLTAGMMVTLTGFMGLGLDVGSLYNHRRLLQTAADAGALGGGSEIYRGQSALVTSSVLSATAENGYTHGADGVEVTVNWPPLGGAFAGDPEAVEVLIDQPSPTYFMRMLGWTDVDITARAVAWIGADDINCIYVLEETEQDTFSYNSSAVLDADCGLRVNSSDGWGTHLTSSAQVTVETASLTGSYVEESSSALNATNGIHTDVWPRSPDPLAYLSPPAYGGCSFVDLELDQPTATLSPGVYCGKLTVKNNTVVTLLPGVYVIQGGAFSTESNAVVNGTGVTFFLTEGGGYDYEPLSFQSSSVLNLTAPTSGPYAGILFYQDPNAGDEDDMHRWESSSEHTIEGALYFPTQIVSFESSTEITGSYMIVVARRMIGDSNSILQMNSDYSSLAGGSPLKRLALVE
tara:strand:- start:7003 stop:8283 length:1281 start_codon:yes stop_codon:yes gene_type:complete